MKIAPSQIFSLAVVAELKRIRLAKGVSQKVLAESAGMSRAAVTHIEASIRNPTMIVCHALSAALGVKLSNIMRRVERSESRDGASRALPASNKLKTLRRD